MENHGLPCGCQHACLRICLHLVSHGLAVSLGIVGLASEWELQVGRGHLLTPHSWLGFLTVVFYAGLWASGGVMFAVSGRSSSTSRHQGWPIHIFAGVSLLCAGLLSIITGLFSLFLRKTKQMEERWWLWNWASVVTLFLAVAVFGSMYRPFRTQVLSKAHGASGDIDPSTSSRGVGSGSGESEHDDTRRTRSH